MTALSPIETLFISTEVYPFAKTGGLADVAAFLPKALRQRGCDVRIMMPKFRSVGERFGDELRFVASFELELAGRMVQGAVETLEYGGNIVYFIDCPHYFDRERIYDYEDELERFVFFCKAALTALPKIGFKPSLLHCNDWLTGFIPFFLKNEFSKLPYYAEMKTLFTIHAMLYQGVFHQRAATEVLGLDWSYFTERGLDFYGQLNCMKIGILTADTVSTVSPSYAAEISKLSPLQMEPLAPVLRKRRKDLHGILNGIDLEENNPATDKRLFANYDANDLSGKAVNKRELQQLLGLPVRPDVPIVTLISRLEITKGLYLLEKSYHELLKDDLQLIVVGDGIPYYDYLFNHIMEKFPNNMRYRTYEETLAYRAYAGADLFLMPSYTEACGISQLIGMRYGTVPIVRETGGLVDTVQPYNAETGEGTGITFKYANHWVMLDAIRRGVELYKDRSAWDGVVARCMSRQLGWEQSAGEYQKLYEQVVGEPQIVV
ncbi:glycogen synthase [Paenibacillus sp. MMS18-CY102]|uniref:glycogen synthase n=1 Tax=Paenibacillus sp. MMS18-CY102 TaxID=2682849 RepID=UPI0013666638|nr:glycogen/starch synthase [Paenibacillus sp. MMS18-CY102]MWC26980.1 glycosyltransferase [Paenibacillus sp. MMS18-CY102]